MALFGKKSEEDRQLAAARRDLEAARQKHGAVMERQDAAAASTDRWEQWTTARDEAAADVERLTVHVDRLQASAEAARREADWAARRKQVEACRAANNAVIARSKDEVARAISTLITFARDAAAAAAEAQRLNMVLPPGAEPIAIGDFVARDLPKQPREDIATEVQTLWVNASGVPVGDQDAVIEGDDGAGTLQINRATAINCTKRRFRSTTFRPAFVADPAGYFFSTLRLPFPDRPGLAFDGSNMVLNQVAKLDVEPPSPPKLTSMPIQTELVAIDPWPPAGIATEADRNAAA